MVVRVYKRGQYFYVVVECFNRKMFLPNRYVHERVKTDKRIPPELLPSFNAFQQKRIRTLVLYFEIDGNRSFRIREHRFEDRDNIPVRTKFFEFFK